MKRRAAELFKIFGVSYFLTNKNNINLIYSYSRYHLILMVLYMLAKGTMLLGLLF